MCVVVSLDSGSLASDLSGGLYSSDSCIRSWHGEDVYKLVILVRRSRSITAPHKSAVCQ